MADLQDICSSGGLTELFLGGTAAGKKAAKVEDLAAAKDETLYTPQVLEPTYVEGKVFYEDEHRALSIYTDVADVTHNLGQEHLIRVKNVSGATIPNGSVCRMAGADPVTGFPQAQLAQADTFTKAIVLGMATHNIANGSFGWVTRLGIVHDINTSDFTAGDLVYLSETVPGALTKSPTKILSRIGQILVVNASTGTILVDLRSLATIPKLFAMLKDKVAAMNLTTAYQGITGYTSKSEINLEADVATGTVVAAYGGTYRATLNMTLAVPSSVQSRSISVQVWNSTDSAELAYTTISIPRDTTSASRSIPVPVTIAAGKSVMLRILASEAINGVTFSQLSFDLESIFSTLQ